MDGQRRLPDPANPRNMNEKFFWRKMFDRRPEFVTISDKLLVRDWLKEREIKIETPQVLWVGTDAADIPDDVLTGGVVVKANHGSGTNIFLESPPPDRAAFNARANKFLRKNHGRNRLEWGYFGVKRRLFVEQMVPDCTMEIKMYLFGRHMERLAVIYDRFDDMCADLWLTDGQGGVAYSETETPVGKKAGRPKPACMDAALETASEIGKNFDHIRVDFLSDGTNLWFSELTVYSLGGKSPIAGDDATAGVNVHWRIQDSWFMRTPQSGWRAIYASRLRLALRASER